MPRVRLTATQRCQLTGKVRFSEQQARARAAVLTRANAKLPERNPNRGREVRAYECQPIANSDIPPCGDWHVTSWQSEKNPDAPPPKGDWRDLWLGR